MGRGTTPPLPPSRGSKAGVSGRFSPWAREPKTVSGFPAPEAEEGLLEKAGVDGQRMPSPDSRLLRQQGGRPAPRSCRVPLPLRAFARAVAIS